MTRENRAATVRTERRRQAGPIEDHGLAFAYDESKLDRDNYEYRMVNDTKGRIRKLEAQDWDIAPEDALLGNTSGGSTQAKHAGVNELGSFTAVLMRKPRWMHKEDQVKKQAHLDEIESRIKSGEHRADAALTGTGTYTPGGGNTISRV